MPTVEDYFNECANFDFLYEYSEDMRIYRKGKKDEMELAAKNNRNPTLQIIYMKWRQFRFGVGNEPRLKDFL